MKRIKNSQVLILMLSIFFVCFRPETSRSIQTSSDQIKSIALISTMIGKIVQPDIPILDAISYNKKINSIAPLIIEEEVKSINGFRDEVALNLKNQFNCDILYGNSLVTIPQYIEIANKFNFPESLNIAKTDNKYFPKIIIPDDEKNPFNYTNGNVIEYMKSEDVAKNIISSYICGLLGTDLVAVSYSTLSVVRIWGWGSKGDICMVTYLFIFDKEGKLVFNDYSKSSVRRGVAGDDMSDYKSQLNTISSILSALMDKVSEKKIGKQ
jgi:hypothetical protein